MKEVYFASFSKLPKGFTGKAIFSNGKEVRYLLNGLNHREDGPARITDHVEEWCIYGMLHRIDGPAVKYKSGKPSYYLAGTVIDYNSHKKIIDILKIIKPGDFIFNEYLKISTIITKIDAKLLFHKGFTIAEDNFGNKQYSIECVINTIIDCCLIN